MRIIHIQDYYIANHGYQENFLMQIQASYGHDVHMITSDKLPYTLSQNKSNSKYSKSINQQSNGINVHYLPSKIFFLKYAKRVWISNLESVVRSLKPDLIHVHGMQSLTSWRIARYAANTRSRSFKLLFDSHAATYNSTRLMKNAFYGIYRRYVPHIILNVSDAIVAIDRWCKDFLINECGIPERDVSIIPLGADHHLFKYSPQHRFEYRTRWGLSNKSPVFIFTGKVIPSKKIHILIDAMSFIMKDIYLPTLIIVGSGDQTYIRSLRMSANNCKNCKIFLFPHVDNYQLPRYYSAADISIWPSISIGTFEAQSCGLPLLVADNPELLDRISYGNGISYVRDDSYSLAEKSVFLSRNPYIREQMSKSGRDAIETIHNWELITQKFMSAVGLSL